LVFDLTIKRFFQFRENRKAQETQQAQAIDIKPLNINKITT
jgi:hypothetical protein